MKVLVLGHRGMLGHMVQKYFLYRKDIEIVVTELRWPSNEFKSFITENCYEENLDYIINCIGAIHQKTSCFSVNTDLPVWLDKNIDHGLSKCRVVHPGTDCENENDEYGLSKKIAVEYILDEGTVTKIIQTSIIGPELGAKVSLFEWFLGIQSGEVEGYCEFYWNGNTTLNWATICHDMLFNWDDYSGLTVPATECISKYELLNIIKEVFGKDIIINRNHAINANRCLVGNVKAPNIRNQLHALKRFMQ